jgi:hypothetical protein
MTIRLYLFLTSIADPDMLSGRITYKYQPEYRLHDCPEQRMEEWSAESEHKIIILLDMLDKTRQSIQQPQI